jgi:hypothetical protein
MKFTIMVNVLMMLCGIALYYCMIVGNERTMIRLIYAEIGSIVLFIGSVSLLKLIKD